MTNYLMGPPEDLVAIESTNWISNLRVVASRHDGTLKDKKDKCNKKNINAMTDSELNDRKRFPIFGKNKNGETVTERGLTEYLSNVLQVTNEDSPHVGKSIMPLPSPYNELAMGTLASWRDVALGYPNVVELNHNWQTDIPLSALAINVGE